jgi:hypothetical protein
MIEKRGGLTMRYSELTILAVAAVALVALVPANGWAQPNFGDPQAVVAAVPALLAVGNDAPVPIIQVHKFKNGGNFRGGFGWGWSGWPGLYGGYGSWPYGNYGGSYLDSPTRTCVWNGYEYKCYNFPSDL